jgi:hypothetical protein
VVAGDFNGWSEKRHPLMPGGGGYESRADGLRFGMTLYSNS